MNTALALRCAAADARRLRAGATLAERRAADLRRALVDFERAETVAAAVEAGRRALAEAQTAPGFAQRRAECASLHALRANGWRQLPDGEWVAPGGTRLEMGRAVDLQRQRDFRRSVVAGLSAEPEPPPASRRARRRGRR